MGTFFFGNAKKKGIPGCFLDKTGYEVFLCAGRFADAVNLRPAHADFENMRYGLRATRYQIVSVEGLAGFQIYHLDFRAKVLNPFSLLCPCTTRREDVLYVHTNGSRSYCTVVEVERAEKE